MKFLLFFAFIFGVLAYFRAAKRKEAYLKAQQHQQLKKTITMVKCEYCGTHIPEHEALIRHGHIWCDEEHERLGSHSTTA
ncbi:hypothetical protein V757_10955 [Pelistega indica]|uniref:Preprotein translocase subunit YajC n=1 Tax=Pelistega indica TaxID=1414851 RepID=V8FUA2_9BURK|nr:MULTISPECIES: PP0621 family protein [Pelistega]ETD67730.1 hypothetical protein V757_10955 [Pelistega indica]